MNKRIFCFGLTVMLFLVITMVKADEAGKRDASAISKTPALETKSLEQVFKDKKGTVKEKPVKKKLPKSRTEKAKEDVKQSASPLSFPGAKSGVGFLKKPLQAKTPPKIEWPERLKDNENQDINR